MIPPRKPAVRRARLFFLPLVLCCLNLGATPAVIRNPTSADTIWKDVEGKEIINFCGSILKVGDTFYWYGWDKYAKTVQVYSSKTLASDSWKEEAILIADGKFHGRPDVIYNPATAKYVMIVKFPSPIGRDGIEYRASSSPTGPFVTQLQEHKVINDGDGVNMGDKGVYQDDDPDRTAYLLCTTDDDGNVNGTTKIVRLKPDYIGQDAVLQSWTVTSGRREALAMTKRNGVYYLTSSATAGWQSSMTRYKTATNISGNWSKLADVRTLPESPDSFNTQHDFVLKIVGTWGTCFMYAGDRWSEDTGVGFGRNAWYPLAFDEQGVPCIQGEDLWWIDAVTGEINPTNASPVRSGAIFQDTFEPDGETAATRGDDGGPGFGRDIQWRPRLGSQAAAYAIVDDPVFGNALSFRQTANSLWLIGQFDGDASDGITFGLSSVSAALGPDIGDTLDLSFRIRVSAPISGTRSFNCGLLFVPDGPLSADPGSDNSWIDPAVGYFFRINENTAAMVPIFKQIGSETITPYQGVAITNLSQGIPGVTAAFGTGAEAHGIRMRFVRTDSGLRVDSFWDGVLVSTAVDDGSAAAVGPFTRFNTLGLLYGTGNVDYIVDDVKLEAIPAGASAALSLTVQLGAGKNLVLNATGGPPGRQVQLLAADNMQLPIDQWSAATNTLDEGGACHFTNTINPDAGRQFYRLRLD